MVEGEDLFMDGAHTQAATFGTPGRHDNTLDIGRLITQKC